MPSSRTGRGARASGSRRTSWRPGCSPRSSSAGCGPSSSGEERGAWDVSGRVRLLTAYAAADALVPPVLLQAQVDGPLGLRGGGVATLTRRRLGSVRYDSRRRALTAGLPGVAFELPKLHMTWAGEHASVLMGTYRLGFAQRLTLDTTGRPAPDGFVPDEAFLAPGAPERHCMLSGTEACSAEEAQGRVTPDFGGTEGFRGVVGHVMGAWRDWSCPSLVLARTSRGTSPNTSCST